MRKTPEKVARGVRIRHARETLGLSPRDLADRLGIPLARLSRWELGYTSPPADMHQSVRDALGLDLATEPGGLIEPLRLSPPDDFAPVEPPPYQDRLPPLAREARNALVVDLVRTRSSIDRYVDLLVADR